MSIVQLKWITCQGNVWCSLDRLNLGALGDAAGVYIIWQPNGRVVRVGQGNISERLSQHRVDPEILAHSSAGLNVTWARVHGSQHNGVECFLAQKLSPLVGERFPSTCETIPCNLPW